MKKPLIVACTSEIITVELNNKLKSVGFDLAFQAPITAAQIN